ncbi:MAG TPA: PQQ-dependent sugar dehydrogenase [Terriglobales bacterium]|nr:PQQ-dependent sugar dehydrogenase [Terriglobales bacterium]
MKTARPVLLVSLTAFTLAVAPLPSLLAQNKSFHNAPASAKRLKDPYAGQKQVLPAGQKLYHHYCARCHGENAEGSGNIPALVDGVLETVSPGEVYWFVTKGNPQNGMPSWAKVPRKERWEIITYVKSLGLPATREAASQPAAPAAAMTSTLKDPPPKPPFTDFRYEQPGKVRKITVQDLPAPYATPSADNGPDMVARPANVWPQAPAGFKVELYATGLDNPRLIRTAPNGDIFVAESEAGDIRVFRGITKDGKPEEMSVFASGLNQPYGINFYPPGPNPQWVYVGQTNAVVRFPYHAGDMKATGKPQHIADLPGGGGHWTRDIQFSLDGKKMFVGVGSRSNVDDPDTHSGERHRANILEFNPDGSGLRIYAYGIRNPGGGLAIDPKTGELWCSVNERDALGNNLVPDYITHVQDGGFYGWPWWYVGGNQDPRLKGKHPELKSKVVTPDVLIQAHSASLEPAFYNGKQFPSQYFGDIFAAEHGSWNRAPRAGYEVIRIPLHQTGHASGEYQDFLTGFVLPNGDAWGRPVGVAVAHDGSLLVSDDGSNSIWRVSYRGK